MAADRLPQEIESLMFTLERAAMREADSPESDLRTIECDAARASLVSAIAAYARQEREGGREEAARQAEKAAKVCEARAENPNRHDNERDAYTNAAGLIRRALSSPPAPAERDDEARERYTEAVEATVKALASGSTKCKCGKPATCVGAYEASENLGFGCDRCCGHGNEDGWCVPLPAEETGGAYRAALTSTAVENGPDLYPAPAAPQTTAAPSPVAESASPPAEWPDAALTDLLMAASVARTILDGAPLDPAVWSEKLGAALAPFERAICGPSPSPQTTPAPEGSIYDLCEPPPQTTTAGEGCVDGPKCCHDECREERYFRAGQRRATAGAAAPGKEDASHE